MPYWRSALTWCSFGHREWARHLVIGIGHKAVQAGCKVLFRTALALVVAADVGGGADDQVEPDTQPVTADQLQDQHLVQPVPCVNAKNTCLDETLMNHMQVI